MFMHLEIGKKNEKIFIHGVNTKTKEKLSGIMIKLFETVIKNFSK